MASSSLSQWKVLIVCEESDFEKNYSTFPDTTLAEVIQMWKDEFQLLSRWKFYSADGCTEYEDGGITLQDVGESNPSSKIVILRAQLFEQTVFVHAEDECRRHYVKPNDKLERILPQVDRKGAMFDHNGLLLNRNQTVKQSCLMDNSVISESSCRVCVKLSSGEIKSFRLPKEALICHLKVEVEEHENGDFSLTYFGRTLQPNEKIKNFKRPVEVSNVNFDVNVDGRQISWKAGSGKTEKLALDSSDERTIPTVVKMRQVVEQPAQPPAGSHRVTQYPAVTRVNLQVFYLPDQFTPDVSRGDLEVKGKFDWWEYYYFNCRVDVPVPPSGWVDFRVILSSLQPLLLQYLYGERVEIVQTRGYVGRRMVAEVTSLADDEAKGESNAGEFCDNEGYQFFRNQVRWKHYLITDGVSALIVQRRRTILRIDSV